MKPPLKTQLALLAPIERGLGGNVCILELSLVGGRLLSFSWIPNKPPVQRVPTTLALFFGLGFNVIILD